MSVFFCFALLILYRPVWQARWVCLYVSDSWSDWRVINVHQLQIKPRRYPETENPPLSLASIYQQRRNRFKVALATISHCTASARWSMQNKKKNQLATSLYRTTKLGGGGGGGGDWEGLKHTHAPVQISIWLDCIFPWHHATWSMLKENRLPKSHQPTKESHLCFCSRVDITHSPSSHSMV